MSPRGGKREGAGRPPFRLGNKPMVDLHVFVTAEQKAKAARIGRGDMAAGVRLALDAFVEQDA